MGIVVRGLVLYDRWFTPKRRAPLVEVWCRVLEPHPALCPAFCLCSMAGIHISDVTQLAEALKTNTAVKRLWYGFRAAYDGALVVACCTAVHARDHQHAL